MGALFACALLLLATSSSPGLVGDGAKDDLKHPCRTAMRQRAPHKFSVRFPTNYGTFVATCERARAPVWADRVYNLAQHGYYDDNYFFRVIHTERLSVAQFGTAGDPAISNIYNWSSSPDVDCAILKPQPPEMPCVCSHPPTLPPSHPPALLPSCPPTLLPSCPPALLPGGPSCPPALLPCIQ